MINGPELSQSTVNNIIDSSTFNMTDVQNSNKYKYECVHALEQNI